MSKILQRFQNSGASALEQAKTHFPTSEPNPEEYLLEKWLALAEAVLRKPDAQADKAEEDETAHSPQ